MLFSPHNSPFLFFPWPTHLKTTSEIKNFSPWPAVCLHQFHCFLILPSLWFLLSCYGRNCVSQKLLWWSPNPQHLRMWLYLEIGSLNRWLVEMKSLEWFLMQHDWCPCKRKFGHGDVQRKDQVKTQSEDGHLQTKGMGLRRNPPGWRLDLGCAGSDCDKMKVYV